MSKKPDTKVCPHCIDGRIVSRAEGQKVSVVCTTCNGEVLIPADHPAFAAESAPASA